MNTISNKPKLKLSIPAVLTIALISAMIVGACVYAWQASLIESREQRAAMLTQELYQKQVDELKTQLNSAQQELAKKQEEANKLKETACDFSKQLELKQTTKNYSMFGDDEFETIVCGHLVHYQETLFGDQYDRAYLQIQEFADEGFGTQIEKEINSGNTINKKEPNGLLDFSLGCLRNNDIVSDKLIVFDAKRKSVSLPEVMNPDVRKAVLASSELKPVALVLTFGIHEGSESTCPNLAHNIRLY